MYNQNQQRTEKFCICTNKEDKKWTQQIKLGKMKNMVDEFVLEKCTLTYVNTT